MEILLPHTVPPNTKNILEILMTPQAKVTARTEGLQKPRGWNIKVVGGDGDPRKSKIAKGVWKECLSL